MSKQASKTMIGIFVLGALFLVVTGILIFGSGEFLKEKHKFVMFFDGSVKGLDAGAPVVFQGVKVGTVSDIVLRGHYESVTFDIPVFIVIEPDRITPAQRVPRKRNVEETVEILVERGLRARLQMQSVVTGKLMIELDFHPDKPIRLRGQDMDFPEIPTIQTGLEELAEKIEKAPIEEIFNKLHSAVAGIEKVVNSPNVISAFENLNGTLAATRQMVQNIDQQVKPLAKNANMAIADARNLLQNLDRRVEPLASRAEDAVAAADAALEQAKKNLKAIENTTGEDSAVVQDLTRALEEIGSAAHSIRLLADYLGRHPESLLHGKGGPE